MKKKLIAIERTSLSCSVLIGCFILEVLRSLGANKFTVVDVNNYYEPIFERNTIYYTGFDILNDILMLKNQIHVTIL